MSEKRRNCTDEFKREAIRLVTEHGYGVSATARNLGINSTMLGRWKREFETKHSAAFPGNGRLPLDKEEFYRLRDENKRLRMERDILKKPWPSLPAGRPKVCLYCRASGHLARIGAL